MQAIKYSAIALVVILSSGLTSVTIAKEVETNSNKVNSSTEQINNSDSQNPIKTNPSWCPTFPRC